MLVTSSRCLFHIWHDDHFFVAIGKLLFTGLIGINVNISQMFGIRECEKGADLEYIETTSDRDLCSKRP